MTKLVALLLALLAACAAAQSPSSAPALGGVDTGGLLGAMLGSIGSAVPLVNSAQSAGSSVTNAATGSMVPAATGAVDNLKTSLASVAAGLVSSAPDATGKALGATGLGGSSSSGGGGSGVAALAPFLTAVGGRRLLRA